MSKQLRVVLVGYGYWSPKLIRNIRAIPNYQLIAICEKDETRHAHIREEQPGVEIVRHYREAFARRDVDAVVIATIPSSHYRIAKAALEAGKHVLVEKPLTLSTKEGEVLLDESRKRNVVLMVDHTFLYSPAISKLADIVRSGSLGEIYSVESTRVNLGLFQRDTNVVWDLAPHDFSVFLKLFSEKPTHISAVGTKTVVHPKQVRAQESIAHITLYYVSGMSVHVHLSWVSPSKVRQITVIGSECVALYDQLAPEQLMIRKQGVYPSQDDGESGPLFTYKMEESVPVMYEKEGEDLLRMLSAFYDAAEKGVIPVSNASLGLDVVRMLEATEKSIRNGGKRVWIHWSKRSMFSGFFLRWRQK